MRAYKVIFENNVAVSAGPVDFFFLRNMKSAEHSDGQDMLPWLIVLAENEEDGMRVANKMIRNNPGLRLS